MLPGGGEPSGRVSRPKACFAEGDLCLGMDDREVFHSMKVEKIPWNRSFLRSARFLAAVEICEVSGTRCDQGERWHGQLPMWFRPSGGVRNLYETPVSTGSGAIQQHSTNRGAWDLVFLETPQNQEVCHILAQSPFSLRGSS